MPVARSPSPDAASAPPDAPKRVDVAVCVATFRRPRGLHALLGGLENLVFDGPPPSLRVVVVDNDAYESARPVAEAAGSWLRFPVAYRVERRPGAARARNAALDEAMGSARWLAFIDDDEIPEPRWIDALLAVQRRTGADAVAGPVLPRFPEPPPRWVEAGGFFASPRHASGTRLEAACGRNALVRAALLETRGERFDAGERGPDAGAALFARLVAGGAHLVWADEAIVYDVVPPERARAAWIVARGLRDGVARANPRRRRGAGRGRGLGTGLRDLARGLATALLARDVATRVGGLERAARGAGRLGGALRPR